MVEKQNIHWTDDKEMLERFVMNRIEVSERLPLEAHLKECEHCRDAVRQEQELSAGIRLAGRDGLKAQLSARIKKEEANSFFGKDGFSQRYQLISLAAAVVVIVVGLGLFRFYSGAFEWPTKFSSRKYILKNAAPDSSSTANLKEEAHQPNTGNLADREEPAMQAPSSENLTAQRSAGAAGEREDGLSSIQNSQGEIHHGGNAKAFWLLGTVTMIHSNKSDARLVAKTESRPVQERETKKKLSSNGRFTIQKDGVSQTIILSQKPSSSLPERQKEAGVNQTNTIHTLVEKTSRGLNLTLYSSTLFLSSEIENAAIEPITQDSLIVHLANESIAYHIPGGWSAQRSTQTNIERR